MKSSSCKAKGRVLQNWVCAIIRRLFHLSEHDVKPAIMGESGIDIKLSAEARKRFNFAIECKNVEKINIWEAWEQAKINSEKEALIPLLFIKRNRTTPLMVLDAEQGMCLLHELAYLKGLIRDE